MPLPRINADARGSELCEACVKPLCSFVPFVVKCFSRHLRARFWRLGVEQAQRQQTQKFSPIKKGATRARSLFVAYRWK